MTALAECRKFIAAIQATYQPPVLPDARERWGRPGRPENPIRYLARFP
jgi:hypothetical protein